MRFLSFLFGRRKKGVASDAEPSVAPDSSLMPNSSTEEASASPSIEPVPTSTIAKSQYAHLNYSPRVSTEKEDTDLAPEEVVDSPQAEPEQPAVSRIESAPAPIEPPPAPSSMELPPTPLQRGPAPLPRDRARVQWRGYLMEVVGESHYQEALIALCGPYSSRIGVGDTFGFGQKFDALIELVAGLLGDGVASARGRLPRSTLGVPRRGHPVLSQHHGPVQLGAAANPPMGAIDLSPAARWHGSRRTSGPTGRCSDSVESEGAPQDGTGPLLLTRAPTRDEDDG